MSHGSCLCGDVAWEFGAPLEFMTHCHCSRCRKAHGVAFATYVAGPAGGFTLRGSERVVQFESPGGFARCFCGRCGSVVPGEASDGRIFAPAGNLDDDPGLRPLAHIFTASKAPWYEIADALPRFDAYPPGMELPVLPDRPPLDPPGATRGSCLCGGVTYVVEAPPVRCLHCHCGRCRKARSAAHGSNIATAVDGVRFTRGADLLTSYKVPAAQFFTQVFCRVCGSPMPRVDHQRDRAIVPLGGLDDDPGIRPQAHIFAASKAAWFDIADSLPQHREYPQQ